jgi:hypothetical protein
MQLEKKKKRQIVSFMWAAGQPCQIEGGKQSLLQININAIKRGKARPLPLYCKTGV